MLWRCCSILLALMAPLVMNDCGACYGAPLHSNPFANNKLYLDTTTYPWTAPDAVVEQVWRIVTDLYAYFDIDVTTQYPGIRPDVAWVILGGPIVNGLGGVSGIGNFHFGITDSPFAQSLASLVYADGLGNNPLLIGPAVAHEAGHNLGLWHMPAGVMFPQLTGLIPDPPWPAGVDQRGIFVDPYAYLGGELGFAPEPPPWMVCLGMILGRRGRR